MEQAAKTISNLIYCFGVGVALTLGSLALFGSHEFVNPGAMLPITIREQAFIALAVGSIPMLLACMAVYKFNRIKTSLHQKRNFALIFLPGFLCGGCALFIVGLLALLYTKTIMDLVEDFIKP
jgi:hypothetical protein